MRNVTFTMATMHRHGTAFYDFLRLRKAFFVDQLGWDIPHDDDVEMDQYDTPQAHYSLVLDDGGDVVGGARAMPTTVRWGQHTYMLRDAAEGRLGQIPPTVMPDAPASPSVWECTRLVVSDGLATHAERSECLSLLVGGLVDVAARRGASEMICLSRVTLARALRQLGFAAEKRGEAYWSDVDGRQYAVLAMPARPSIRLAAQRPAAGVAHPSAPLPPTHLPQPVALHAPQVA